jgi:hypothetical protein
VFSPFAVLWTGLGMSWSQVPCPLAGVFQNPSTRLWQASVYNCNAFTGDIARSMAYKVPSKYLRPQQFVTQFREMNTGA